MDALLKVMRKASDEEIINLCKLLWPDELENKKIKSLDKLAEILWPDEYEEPEEDEEYEVLDEETFREEIYHKIYERLQWISSSLWGYYFKSKSYGEIVKEVAEKFEVSKSGSIAEIEIRIIQKALKLAWEKMTPKQREKIEKELKKAVEKAGLKGGLNEKVILKAGGYYAFLTTAQLSGFGIYLASTTLLGMATKLIGITLPFVFYTSLTKAISLIIGPPGWIIGGILFLMGLKQPNYKILIPTIAYIALLREKYFRKES